MLTLNDRCLQPSLGTAYILSIVVERDMRPEWGYMHVLDLVFENKEDWKYQRRRFQCIRRPS
jgi:hypothetical protein